jgi:hypothetical protein
MLQNVHKRVFYLLLKYMRVENIEILKTENVKEQQLADMMSLTASLHLINKKIDLLFIILSICRVFIYIKNFTQRTVECRLALSILLSVLSLFEANPYNKSTINLWRLIYRLKDNFGFSINWLHQL